MVITLRAVSDAAEMNVNAQKNDRDHTAKYRFHVVASTMGLQRLIGLRAPAHNGSPESSIASFTSSKNTATDRADFTD